MNQQYIHKYIHVYIYTKRKQRMQKNTSQITRFTWLGHFPAGLQTVIAEMIFIWIEKLRFCFGYLTCRLNQTEWKYFVWLSNLLLACFFTFVDHIKRTV